MQSKKKLLPNIYNFLRPKQTKNLARFGAKKDGGYIVDLNAVSKVNFLISFGMAEEFSFEIDFLNYNSSNRLQIYDHTVNHKIYLSNILKVLRRFVTFRKNLKELNKVMLEYYSFLKFIYNSNVNFFNLKISDKIREKKEIDLDKIFSKIDKSIKNIGLKIDIEGDEYKILDKVLENSNKINFIIIEFHETGKNNKRFINIATKLTKIFDIIHIHGNNHESLLPDGFPKVIEMSLVNKKNNLIYTDYPKSFPIKELDFPNNPFLPDIEINFNQLAENISKPNLQATKIKRQ